MITSPPAPGTAWARHRRVVRPAVLVAVLLGLFLMHGGPAAADGGCHGAMSDTTVMPAAPGTMTAHPVETPRAAGEKPTAHAGEAMRGALCLATHPRSEIPLPPLTAVALVFPAGVLLPWARRGYGDTRHRGPPAGGRSLLLQVCIART
ncbi:hypothetical protein GCM10010260_38550 [Streptomyces filipinensis]|uniref:Uncharacterized protein n=1 Tax=Streptomyces filipinensis TaxID=66887 RepID=A0A918IDG0_9ACTN|nr:hypothetical protein [Streptomyces filipinensis]GGU98790.1 hypothetical protein GCM10010260_38550 [Streptomyces filipinensis]